MATKNNPGQFDCYARAEPDEPVFVLLGRDPVAPCLVEAWRYLRAGMLAEAMIALESGRSMLLASGKPLLELSSKKSREAHSCRNAMVIYSTR